MLPFVSSLLRFATSFVHPERGKIEREFSGFIKGENATGSLDQSRPLSDAPSTSTEDYQSGVRLSHSLERRLLLRWAANGDTLAESSGWSFSPNPQRDVLASTGLRLGSRHHRGG